MTEQILVPFEGEDSGVGELTWGQHDMWRVMQREKTSLSIGGWLPLPQGSTVAGVVTDLGFLMCRYAALRTRLGFADDGRPLQVVSKSGEVPLEIVDAGDADPAETAAALHRRYDRHVFDYAREWPIRWAVIVSRGAATHLVSVISHLASDGVGVVTMLNDLASRGAAAGAGSPAGEPGCPPAERRRAALPRSVLTWGRQRDVPGEKCYLHLNNVPDTVNYELLADTCYLSPADMEAILRGLEAVLVEAADDLTASGTTRELHSDRAPLRQAARLRMVAEPATTSS
jgi:hypothetical protein